MKPGNGIAINANRFHSLYSKGGAECEFLCAILNPSLICCSARLEQAFVRPFTAPGAPDAFPLSSELLWQKDILDSIAAIVDIGSAPTALLMMQAHFFKIWNALYQNILQNKEVSLGPEPQDQKQAAMRKMIDFVKHNYWEKLTLMDIAKAGFVSKNGCITLFRKYLNDTPVNYLIRYRLGVGAGLLRETQLPIAAISDASGFTNPSYFTELFHKFYGCTPGEYREGK